MSYYTLLIFIALILILGVGGLLLLSLTLKNSLEKIKQEMGFSLEKTREYLEKSERMVREELSQGREESQKRAKELREEVAGSIKNFSEILSNRIGGLEITLKNQLEAFGNQLKELTQSNASNLEKHRFTLEEKLKELQEGNQKKLDEMKAVVEEKLQSTLEKRLGESFKQVSERLEKVHRGLGEMQNLATGVGDLKKVLSNVKSRGTWGEVQLGNLLDQILSPQQYEKNTATRPNRSERVEFAIRLPGPDNTENPVWLPIDAKFPLDAYQELVEAYDRAVPEEIENLRKIMDNRLKSFAKDIAQKYLEPPFTTDFALMYLPVEGLYAEVLQRPGLFDLLQKNYRVIVTGPTTLTALVNSLQMGFRTLAVEKRSSEIRELLGAVKNQFGKFGDLLDKTQKKLSEASNTIEDATKKSRYIEGRLGKVEELPTETANKLLGE